MTNNVAPEFIRFQNAERAAAGLPPVHDPYAPKPEPTPEFSSDSGFNYEQHVAMADDLVRIGKLTREEADALLKQAGTPQATPDARTKEQRQFDEFYFGKSDLTLADYNAAITPTLAGQFGEDMPKAVAERDAYAGMCQALGMSPERSAEFVSNCLTDAKREPLYGDRLELWERYQESDLTQKYGGAENLNRVAKEVAATLQALPVKHRELATKLADKFSARTFGVLVDHLDLRSQRPGSQPLNARGGAKSWAS